MPYRGNVVSFGTSGRVGPTYLEKPEAAREFARVGFPMPEALAVFFEESWLSPDAEGDRTLIGERTQTGEHWGPAVGITQIRTIQEHSGTGSDRDIEKLRGNARAQIEAGYRIWKAEGWRPWAAYTSGRYRQHLNWAEEVYIAWQTTGTSKTSTPNETPPPKAQTTTVTAVATRADRRGWGPGWPNCQYSNWRTVSRPDGVRISVHKDIAVLVLHLLKKTEELGYNLVPGWCWGSACRAIRGSSSPSNHSWGLAVDLNAPENPMGPRNGKIRQHPKVIALWKSYGFGWGGDYSGRADDMHLEFLGTPADAKRFTDRISGTEDELTNEEKQQLAAVYKALYSKREGQDHEHLNILERKIDALAAKEGISFNKDGSVASGG